VNKINKVLSSKLFYTNRKYKTTKCGKKYRKVCQKSKKRGEKNTNQPHGMNKQINQKSKSNQGDK